MRIWSMLALGCLLSLSAVGPAGAHALLESASPAVGGSVAEPPGEVVLRFSGAIEAGFSRIELHDAAGGLVAGPAAVAGGPGELRLVLPVLAPGEYQVVWHVTSIDGHMTQGRFGFRVGK